MMDEHGVWHTNTTCPKCRKRHPAAWTCQRAAQLALAQRPVGLPVPEDTKQAWLDHFLLRAGFTHGWADLESWARRMAEQAYEERCR